MQVMDLVEVDHQVEEEETLEVAMVEVLEVEDKIQNLNMDQDLMVLMILQKMFLLENNNMVVIMMVLQLEILLWAQGENKKQGLLQI